MPPTRAIDRIRVLTSEMCCKAFLSSLSTAARKRKQTAEALETGVVSNSNDDDDQSKSKARRVSTDAQEATYAVASHETNEETPTANANATTASSTPIATPETSLESAGALIQDLLHSDNAKVNAALQGLNLDSMKDEKKREFFVAAGGCLALVQALKKCLDKAMKKIPQCDQVTNLNVAELIYILKALTVILNLTGLHEESRVGITVIGGVEAVVKIMKTFPKCQNLQERACAALRNLAYKNVTGKKQAIESGGIEAVLAAINNHLDSASLCERACWALSTIVDDSKENTVLLLSLGGGAAVANVKTKWPDDGNVQTALKSLTQLIVAEMSNWL
jgi:hypothetical protein